MTGQDEATVNAAKGASGSRQRSTIAFPYMDLKASIDLTDAIFRNVAAGECDDAQLAAWSGQSSKSSTFRVQVYAARTFGILTGEGSRHKLTDLGLCIVDAQRSREAKVRAFLNVPLYSALFEKFKSGQLPPAAALEREIVGLGVAPKQKDRARQVFERAAEQAGFFAHGRDRLIQPGIAGGVSSPSPDKGGNGGGGGSGGSGGSGGGNGNGGNGQGLTGDPLIDALVAKLPKVGGTFTEAQRTAWISLMKTAFDVAYQP